jgi:SAM-dependent methyltransferase
MSAVENIYGHAKRLTFCAAAIAERAPHLVLDVGCGTGANLTRPLAERFPAVRFIGVDSDATSIEHARRANVLPNLEYGGDELLARTRAADLVIASEVIEHIEEPEAFLANLRARVALGGALIVTLPNGRGPFEFASFVESLLRLSGVLAALSSAKRGLLGKPVADIADLRDTLAASPHINFFTWKQVHALFAHTGFAVRQFQPRTLLCGFGFDHLLRSRRLIDWNSRFADRLPASAASAWMFLLEPSVPLNARTYHRGLVARWRRRLNERVLGMT